MKKEYYCICGEKFDNPQVFNGHKAHCVQHQIYKYGDLQYLESVQKCRTKTYCQHTEQKRKDRELQRAEQWKKEKHCCEWCGQIMSIKYGSGRFCCKKCATDYARSLQTQETRKKQSEAMKEVLKKRGTIPIKERPIKYCQECNRPLSYKNRSGYCHACIKTHRECSPITRQKLSQKSKENQKLGKIKSWAPRNIVPTEEQRFIDLLTKHQIAFVHDQKVTKKEIGASGRGVYKLDFCIGKIDVELDSLIHTRENRKNHDQIRDENLTKAGYVIYRIPTYTKEYKENFDQIVEQLLKFIEMHSYYRKEYPHV